MFVIPRDKVLEIRPFKDKGWLVQLKEGIFDADVLILFEETAHLAEAYWVNTNLNPMPTYVKVESEHA